MLTGILLLGAMIGFVLAMLAGAILLYRARRRRATLGMLVGAILVIAGSLALTVGMFIEAGLGPLGHEGLQLYEDLAVYGRLATSGGLLSYGLGFLVFSAGQTAAGRRTDELEEMVRSFSEGRGRASE